jgi:diguanylate cyclase (GGDEF)-like protein
MFLSRLWQRAWSLLLVELNGQEINWLLRPRGHISLLASRRISMILSRVRLIAGLFALLTPLWIVVDIITFPKTIWIGLALGRLVATAAFIAILLSLKRLESVTSAHRALALLLLIPTLFFIYSHLHLSAFQLDGVQAGFATGYAYLPFVMLAGLSIFPLTLIEGVVFAAPMLLAQAVAAALQVSILSWPTLAAGLWLLALIASVSILAGLSQLALMIVLVREAIRDKMTGCFSRQSGEELLELQFKLAVRSGAPVAVAFFDLDHFKSVNDVFGHDAGDLVLTRFAENLRGHLRTGDMLIRWGGEEFLLLMPNITGAQADFALQRLRLTGFGQRPDNTPVTASIGIAERQSDTADSWRRLVEIADARMYEAKRTGRDRIVGCPA